MVLDFLHQQCILTNISIYIYIYIHIYIPCEGPHFEGEGVQEVDSRVGEIYPGEYGISRALRSRTK